MRKSGFTVAEFVISITVMVILMTATFPIVFKKTTGEERIIRNDGEKTCTCNDLRDNIYDCNWIQGVSVQNDPNTIGFELDPRGRNEFVTVQLIGGGAGGGTEVGGSAGEAKILHFPLLKGRFKVILGAGGQPGRNGGTTLMYKLNETDNQWILFASAKGGVANSEKIDTSGLTRDGETSTYSKRRKEGDILCGSGGGVGRAGNTGEVVINW